MPPLKRPSRLAPVADPRGDRSSQIHVVVSRDLLDSARRGDDGAIVGQAERLSRLAWQVGLVSLAGVAIDVADCARRNEAVALTATLARAVRVANRSLTEIWDEVSGL